jgi:hypothetical protein
MSKEESKEVYQLILERTGSASMIVSSNRDTAEWLAMIDDVLLAQSAVDHFKNAAFDFIIEGESYRPGLSPSSTTLTRRRRLPPKRRACTPALALDADADRPRLAVSACKTRVRRRSRTSPFKTVDHTRSGPGLDLVEQPVPLAASSCKRVAA